jgi:nucleoside-diphosphate-sugar epimerase
VPADQRVLAAPQLGGVRSDNSWNNAASGSFEAMRLLVTGGLGVLGRALLPLLEAAGHEISAPGPEELDLFDAGRVGAAVARVHGVYHLATHIPPADRMRDREAWRVNDRLRGEASRLLVDAALAASVGIYVVPTVTFVYPDGEVDESTPLGHVPEHLQSALAAEQEAARFAASGRRGVVLRLGRLDGPGTGYARPSPRYGATLHVDDAASALLAGLDAPGGVYNVVRDGERVSNARFKQATNWRPSR